MKVIKTEKIYTNKGTHALTRYEFDTGHTAHIYRPDDFFVYTKSGNFAGHKTIRNVLLTISMYNCGE
jgi:hypothetical protein